MRYKFSWLDNPDGTKTPIPDVLIPWDEPIAKYRADRNGIFRRVVDVPLPEDEPSTETNSP